MSDNRWLEHSRQIYIEGLLQQKENLLKDLAEVDAALIAATAHTLDNK
jgi:hypothetical protein